MAEGAGILIAVGDESINATYFNNAWIEFTGRSMEDQVPAFKKADLFSQNLSKEISLCK